MGHAIIDNLKSAFHLIQSNYLKGIYLLLTGYILYCFFYPLSPHQGRAAFLLIIFVALFLQPAKGEAPCRSQETFYRLFSRRAESREQSAHREFVVRRKPPKTEF